MLPVNEMVSLFHLMTVHYIYLRTGTVLGPCKSAVGGGGRWGIVGSFVLHSIAYVPSPGAGCRRSVLAGPTVAEGLLRWERGVSGPPLPSSEGTEAGTGHWVSW